MKEKPPIKHDTEENWQKAVNFIPQAGEMIIYEGVIENGAYIKMPRFKIGDGITKLIDLPFLALQTEKEYRAENKTLVLN